MSIRLYLELDGETFRVHDTAYAKGKHQILELGDPAARYRVFVTKEKKERLYTFAKGEGRGVTERELARQLRASAYAAEEPFDASKLTPGRRPR
jgi:hypothetical protein